MPRRNTRPFEIRRATVGDVSRRYDRTEVVERARTVEEAVSVLRSLVLGQKWERTLPASEVGIFDTEAGRWLRGYFPRALA